MIQQLQDIWQARCRHYSNDAATAAALFDEIRRRYTAPARYYHNLQHIYHLSQLALQHRQELESRDVIMFSIFYHDFKYNVLRKDNEARSAAIAEVRLKQLRVPADIINVIKDFIKATQTHQIPKDAACAGDLAWFLDFDMAILAAPWEQYETYARQVRQEYGIFPDLMYNPGRKKFLQNTLAKGHVFHTQHFRQQHEAAALANMARELEWYQ